VLRRSERCSRLRCSQFQLLTSIKPQWIRESTVVIPLREPHEGIRAIWFDTDTITTALEIIRLLRTGKIGAVSVSPLGRRPSVFYMFNGVSKEDRQACRRERVQELLGTCTECEVLEWRSLQP